MFALLAVWLLPAIAWRTTVQRRNLRKVARRRGVAEVAAFVFVDLIQHAVLALEWAFFGALLSLVAPPVVVGVVLGVSYVVAQIALGIDCLMHAYSGYRIELMYVRLVGQLPLFDPTGVRRRQLVLVAALATIPAAVITRAIARTAELLPSDPLPLLGAALIGLGIGGAATSRLPGAFAFQWDNRLFLAQIAALRGWWKRRPPPPAVPSIFQPQNEDYVAHEQPLLRTTRRFTGDRLVTTRPIGDAQPHVIVVLLESFRASDVGVLGGRHDVSPCFDALAKEGVLWDNFYTNATTTAQAAVATLYGVPSRARNPNAQADPNAPPLIGLPDIFARRGYLSGLFQAGDLSWDNGRRFFATHGFSQTFGAKELLKIEPDAERMLWGVHDEVVFRFHLEWLKQQAAWGRPTFSTLFTISNHFPWEVPAKHPRTETAAPKGSPYASALQSMRYCDHHLGEYVDGLRSAGLADDVVLCVMADTGQQFDAESGAFIYAGDVVEEALRVPFLLWSPRWVSKNERRSEIGSQLDVLPTLLDLFAFEERHHSYGTSLLRARPRREAYFVQANIPFVAATRFDDQRYSQILDTGADLLDHIDPLTHLVTPAAHVASTISERRSQVLDARDFIEDVYRRHAYVEAEHGWNEERLFPGALTTQPPDFPRSLDHIRSEIARPLPTQAKLRGVHIGWNSYLRSTLSEEDKLTLARLRYKRTFPEHCGPCSPIEEDRWTELNIAFERAVNAAAEQFAIGT